MSTRSPRLVASEAEALSDVASEVEEKEEAEAEGAVPSRAFYLTYHGHEPEFLHRIYTPLRRQHRRMIFLAGDSSLDNKYWFADTAPAVNGYELLLRPPVMKQDVCYWINHEIVER